MFLRGLSRRGSRHQLHIVYGSLGCLTEIIQQPLLVQIIEGSGYTICLLCHLKTTINELCDRVLELPNLIAEEFCALGQQITQKHTIHGIIRCEFTKTLGVLLQF